MNFEFIHIIWTVLLVLLFLGIVRWAWSDSNKEEFNQAAHLPLQDDMLGKKNTDDRNKINSQGS